MLLGFWILSWVVCVVWILSVWWISGKPLRMDDLITVLWVNAMPFLNIIIAIGWTVLIVAATIEKRNNGFIFKGRK